MPQTHNKPAVAVFGLSHWGKHFIRILQKLRVPTVGVDPDPKKIEVLRNEFPLVTYHSSPARAMKDPRIYAVIIATPTSTHYKVAKTALSSGKHVFVEKPMTQNTGEAKKLLSLARKKDRILMVDHTYVYSPALDTAKRLIKKGMIGAIRTISSVRVGPGIIRHDSTVLWDLTPHDISICWFLLGAYPLSSRILTKDRAPEPDGHTRTLELTYPGNVRATVKVSWVAPKKIRRLTIRGTKGTLTISWKNAEELLILTSRTKRRVPTPKREPLEMAIRHFLSRIHSGIPPLTDAEHGIRVIGIISELSEGIPLTG